jgi:hypothetical protein
MKTITHNSQLPMTESTRTILNYSFVVAFVYALIFAIAKMFNLEGHVELRFLNYLVLFLIAYSAIKKVYNINGQKIEYFSGFSKTLAICILGQLWFTILFFIYLKMDQNFTAYLTQQLNGQLLYPEISISAVLFSEGLAISFIVALAIMQYFKRKRGRWASQS